MVGKPLYEWFPIAGTEDAGGSQVDAFSGMTVRTDLSEIWIAAAAGHAAGHDNRVVSLRLTLDQPAWVLRKAPSAQVADNVAYYPDGAPAGRHVYHSIHWVGSVNRVMLSGLRYTHPGSYQFPTVDGFDPDTNTWDPAGTWADVPGGFGIVRDDQDRIWTQNFASLDPATNTWTPPLSNLTKPVRFPGAYDSKRKQIFTLMVGDGQGYDGPDVNAARVTLTSPPVQTPVTIQPGEAFTSFSNPMPTYAAMEYDPLHDQFLFYEGQHAPGRVYVITPADEGAWPMAVLPLGPGSQTPPATPGNGIHNRFQYVPQLKGFVLLPHASSTLYFLRVG